MNIRRKILSSAAIGAALASFALAPSAQATSTDGSWWSGVKSCLIARTIQVHYRNYHDSNGTLYTRADGYNVGGTTGYIRSINTKEYHANGGSQVGPGRYLTFTGTATASSFTGFGESYLPYILTNPSDGATGQVAIGTTGGACAVEFNIGQS